MKKLIIKIGNETHELPYNDEVFSFEVSDKYVPKVGDCVKISFKETKYEYFSKINQILPKEIRLKSAVNESSKVILNWSLYHDYPDIFLTQITPEELKAKYAEAGYDWDYESDSIKPLKWFPRSGNKVWLLNSNFELVKTIFYENNESLQTMLEKDLLFRTKVECQKFADHCMSYINNKKE